ncbi:hypothetical protein OROHE_016038 [Orobanche hederae]
MGGRKGGSSTCRDEGPRPGPFSELGEKPLQRTATQPSILHARNVHEKIPQTSPACKDEQAAALLPSQSHPK